MQSIRRKSIILATLLLLASSVTTQARTLKIATLAPEGSSWMTEMRKGADAIKQQTQGRIQLKFYPGGIMGNDRSVLRKIRVGQLHGGAFPAGGLADVHIDTQIYGLPYLFRSDEEADYVRVHMDDLLRAKLAEQGMITLGISGGGFAQMMCERPLRSVDDLAGQKIWIPEGDKIAQAVLEVAGVSAIPLPLADVYTGLQTGLVDTVTATPVAAIAFQWHTRIKHITEVPLFYLYGMLVLDKRAFDKIKAEDQQVLKQVVDGVFKQLNELSRKDNRAAAAALQQQGIHFEQPAAAELKRWQGIADRAIQLLGERGVYSEKMLQTLRKHLQDYRRRVNP